MKPGSLTKGRGEGTVYRNWEPKRGSPPRTAGTLDRPLTRPECFMETDREPEQVRATHRGPARRRLEVVGDRGVPGAARGAAADPPGLQALLGRNRRPAVCACF